MNTIKKQMDKVIEKKINNMINIIKSTPKKERGKKKLYAKFLKLIKPIIIEMLGAGYEIKMINEIINDTFDIEINYITFFRWVKRNITIKEIKENTKSNIKEEKVSNSVPKEKKEKKENPNPKKEVQDEKNKLDLKKDINTKKDIEKKPGNAVDILNDDINITNDEYKDLI